MIDYTELIPPEARPLEPLGLYDVSREGLEDSLAKANQLASANRWSLALPWYYTTFQHSEDPVEKTQAQLGQVEVGIRLGRLNQAREWLVWGEVVNKLDQPDYEIFSIHRTIKMSKIFDRLGDFNRSLELSGEAIAKLPGLRIDEGEFQYLSAEANLVMAKAYLASGIVRSRRLDIKTARTIFEGDLFRSKVFNDQVRGAEQYLWLSRCDLILEGSIKAGESSFAAHALLREATQDNPDSALFYMDHQVRGEELLYQRLAHNSTLKEFAEAFRLTTQVEDNPLAAAEAALGLSKTLALMGRSQPAIGWRNFATTTYPQVLIRPFSG